MSALRPVTLLGSWRRHLDRLAGAGAGWAFLGLGLSAGAGGLFLSLGRLPEASLRGALPAWVVGLMLGVPLLSSTLPEDGHGAVLGRWLALWTWSGWLLLLGLPIALALAWIGNPDPAALGTTVLGLLLACGLFAAAAELARSLGRDRRAAAAGLLLLLPLWFGGPLAERLRGASQGVLDVGDLAWFGAGIAVCLLLPLWRAGAGSSARRGRLLAVILGLLLGAGLADRYGPRVDLTVDGAATLDRRTLRALELLEESAVDVEIVVAARDGTDPATALGDRALEDVLRRLEASSSRISVGRRDSTDGERVVFEARGHRVAVSDRELFRRTGSRDARTEIFVGEAALVAALEQLRRAGSRTVYLLQGHGEPSLDGEAAPLGELMEDLGLQTHPVDLFAGEGPPAVPDGASAVLLIAPRAPLPPPEQEALRAWLGGGGGLGVFLEPDQPVPELLDRLGLMRAPGVLADRVGHGSEAPIALHPRRHPLSRSLADEGRVVLGRGVAPLRTEPVEGVRVAAFLESGSEPRVDVGVAATVGAGRLVLVGDASWALDPLLAEESANRELASAVVRWLVGDEVGVVVGTGGRALRRVEAPPAQWWLALGLTAVLWPVLVAGLGLLGVRRRRGR